MSGGACQAVNKSGLILDLTMQAELKGLTPVLRSWGWGGRWGMLGVLGKARCGSYQVGQGRPGLGWAGHKLWQHTDLLVHFRSARFVCPRRS